MPCPSVPPHPIMANIGYTGPDLSEPATARAFVDACDASLSQHRAQSTPRHFTRSALGLWYPQFSGLKKLLPSNARRLRRLVLRYGPQAAEPLTMTGLLKNEVLRGAVRFTSRGQTRSLVWPNAPKYIFRRPRNSTFDKAAAIVATNKDDANTIKLRIDAQMQKYFDSHGSPAAATPSP